MQKDATQASASADQSRVPLAMSLETLGFIIAKAKQFDAKDPVTDVGSGSNPIDDNEIGVLEDHRDDSTAQELTALINSLSEDEQVDLVALNLVRPRGLCGGRLGGQVRAQAATAHNNRTAQYLLGTPLLGDFLEEGLATLGYSHEDYE